MFVCVRTLENIRKTNSYEQPALIWGIRGRGFKSRQPDKNVRIEPHFFESRKGLSILEAMINRVRAFSLAIVSSLILSMITLVLPAKAGTTTFVGEDSSGPVVVVFSLDPWTDDDQEDVSIRDALISISNTVKVFDGGDGSSGDWESALAGVDVLVFPEVHAATFWAANDTAVLTAAAKSYIKSWAESGKLIVGTGSYSHLQMITDLTGVDFTSVGENGLSNGESWELFASSSTLPALVPHANKTGAISNYTSLSAGQKAVLTRIYYDTVDDSVAVANFTVGSGYYVYNAYDWYPDSNDISSGRRAAWNETLQFAASGQITGQTFDSSEAEAPSAPRAPVLPRLDNFNIEIGENGQPQLRIEGKRLWCISSMTIDGMDIPFTSGFSTPWYEYLNADLSGVTPGKKTLVVQSCMGKVTYTNWFTIPSPVEPKSMWTKVSSFGLSEAAKAKIAAFNSNLGDGYTKIRCIVNSANGDDMNEALVAQVCTFANSNDASDAIAVLETRDSFAGSGYWINIWVSGN